eukprot:1140176-Pelagomonas_calceolata.AAC.7
MADKPLERKGETEGGEDQRTKKHIYAGEDRPGVKEKQYHPMKLAQLSKYGLGDRNRPRYVRCAW